MHPFECAWKRFYPYCHPLGFLLREARTPHWVRFHALPRSKRHAGDGLEMQVLLKRFNTLADVVLGVRESIWIANCQYAGPPAGDTDTEERRDYAVSADFTFTAELDHPDGSTQFSVFAARTSWQSRAFDKLFRSIAKYEAGHWLWMSDSTGAVFAPYDSGVDLFLPNAAMVQHLRGDMPIGCRKILRDFSRPRGRAIPLHPRWTGRFRACCTKDCRYDQPAQGGDNAKASRGSAVGRHLRG